MPFPTKLSPWNAQVQLFLLKFYLFLNSCSTFGVPLFWCIVWSFHFASIEDISKAEARSYFTHVYYMLSVICTLSY